MVINTAFFPTLMWNSRFASLSGDPFDNSAGFTFPLPEGNTLSYLPQLLVAQAFIPPTERVEAAGFVFPGDNNAIRAEVINRLNTTAAYRKLFGEVFPAVKRGAPISYDMFASAIAEFEFTLVFANAPIDRYARGQKHALSNDQKQGALLFFGAANCVQCHKVSGQSNEMFSDFDQHVLGVPQVVPAVSNMVFDGPGQNEDFGLEQFTGNANDRYKFRTSPLRNVALQPTFFHNGAFTRLEDAIRHHLDVAASVNSYSPAMAGLAPDLLGPVAPMGPVLAKLDPLVAQPTSLTEEQFRQLVDFVSNGLLDPRAKPEHLKVLVPKSVPSGRPVLNFEFK
jgi:cytochrome c peroxidase